MTDNPDTLEGLLMARLAVAQKISAATAEHLRLNQRLCGMEVLEMGEVEETAQGMAMLRDEISACEGRIGTLERDMAALDEALARHSKGEAT
ncbi:hypothetical protein [Salipiger sp.]|uniref:hypothetical protein n=1 Tax=Salipiger sp. TaxID=2078585 RepID=UPI003A972F4E